MKNHSISQDTKIQKETIRKWQMLWNLSANAHFFNSPDYFLSCLKNDKKIQYIIFQVYKKGELEAILPLVWEHKFGIKTLTCSDGFGDALDQSSLLMKEVDANLLRFIIESITKKANLYLKELEDTFVDLLRNEEGKVDDFCKVEFSCKRPWTRIEENSFRHMKGKSRRTLQKRMEKNKDQISFEFSEGGINFDFERLVLIEQKSWKGLKKIALFDDNKARRLYRTWINDGEKKVLIAVMKYEQEEMAYLFGHFFKNKFLVTNMAFDVSFSKIAPGKILVVHVLEYLKNRKTEIFDFSIGESRIKNEFCDRAQDQFNCYFGKNRLVCIWWRSILFLKRMLKKLK